MLVRGIFAAFAALLVSATLIESVAAYPVTARSGTTTVTRTYAPLDLDLQLASGQLLKDPVTNKYGFTGLFNGLFSSSVGSGYTASGTAGNWTLNLGDNAFNNTNSTVANSVISPIMDGNVTDSVSGNVITLRDTANNRPMGTLVYGGGLSLSTGILPAWDTPNTGDMFLLYARNAGAVLDITVDNILNPTNFLLQFAGNNYLQHLGPYVKVAGADNLYKLDDTIIPNSGGKSRVNPECTTNGRSGCGSVPNDSFFVSSTPRTPTRVPEPASLALVGLALVGLALVRRRQQGPRSV